MCEFAQRTVCFTKSCSDPVGDLSDERGVRVVYTDQLRDLITHKVQSTDEMKRRDATTTTKKKTPQRAMAEGNTDWGSWSLRET